MAFEVGKIVNTQGIKGDVRVIPTTFDERRFELLTHVEVVLGKSSKRMEIERVWYHKQFVIIKFKEITDMNGAELLKGATILIADEEALPLSDDEYYLRDLYGMMVVTDEGENLGELVNVLATGANDVYVVRGRSEESGQENDTKKAEKEILIPAIKQCIIKVSVAENKMTVKLLPGL